MKKVIFSLLGILALSTLSAQNLRINEVDEFTGDSKKITESYTLANGVTKIKGSVAHLGEAYAIYMYSNMDMGCGGAAGNYVMFLFEDGTTLRLSKDIADIDCSHFAQSIYILNPEDFEGKTVTKIRFNQSKAYDDCIWDGKYTMNQLLESVK